MSTQESINLFNTYYTYTNTLADQSQPFKSRLSGAQAISEGFENIVTSQHYSAFLEYLVPKILQTLQDSEPQFVSETQEQELRKILLEVLHRIPTNEQLKPFVKPILTLMFAILEIENEENVLVALRIIIELHKQYRPQMQTEIQAFLLFVKGMYKDLANNAKVHFEVLSVGPDGVLPPDKCIDPVQGVMGSATNSGKVPESPSASSEVAGKSQSNSIAKATTSLKVLAELPIIVVLMYQIYKQNVQAVISEYIALVMNTITLQPTLAARKSSTFNKEVYVDFTAAQIKTLSILAYFARIFQDLVAQSSGNLVGGMLGLFRYCPQEVAHLRKELLIAAKHILGTDLRTKFVPHIEQLFDEDVLIGNGWTVNEGLRPLAYSTLADFVHHVRAMLTLSNLALAVHVFSKNVHDESLLISMQRMSCKLLLNLVECIRQKSDEQGAGREILMKMLEVFVRKFKTIAKQHIPAILEKCIPSDAVSTTTNNKAEETQTNLAESSKEKSSIWRGSNSKDNLSVADYREMVKTLVCGVKTITWGAGSCKLSGDAQIPVYPQGNKVFLPSETKIFIRLLKYALEALDVYQISVSPTGNGFIKMANSPQLIRMKEEKEILEHFAGVFTMLNTATFKEVFTATIEYLVDRIHSNYALQIIPNSFLANPHTSATFATILVRFLLNKLEHMGTKSEKSNLYLKLFKLVFGSVSLFAQENEQMLKPHLHDIVNRSMELAMSAKEPYNYFLLLRALFRSIGGGSHDLLYQEFLPLLPNLLQGLNNLQSGIHKQYMKDLFVELCLTVPVRLSSLLPYLPMLMDPLVSALNGTQTLVSQGLRTLELCVDNLQPDFLYDHIQPVRADLMQALWRTLRNTMETIAHVAFRVLGKFGGASRRMLKEPQKLTYQQSENIGPCLLLSFLHTNEEVELPVASVIERAGHVLKTPMPSTSSVSQQSNVSYDNTPFYRQQAWNIVKYFIVAALSLEDNTGFLEEVFQDTGFKNRELPVTGKPCVAPCADEQSKKTFQQALTGMLFAASTKELQDDSLPFMAGILRHFALVTVTQQAGTFAFITQKSINGMDVHTIIDSIADIMSHEDKDLCKTGELAIQILYETVSIVLQDRLKAAQLPFFEYLVEKLCGCCYQRPWFAKSGGCLAIKFLMNHMPLHWVLSHQPTFITALMFVMMDLTNEVSSGTVEAAKSILVELLKRCNGKLEDEELTSVQVKVFPLVVQHMVREVVSPNHTVRAQARNALDVLSQLTGKSIHSLMEPHKALLEDMIPPKKHLLRHQPANTQIALMDGNTFCTSLIPRLFTMDLTIIEHKVFFTELYTLCEADDSQLTKLPCYKNVPKFAQLRVSALAALTSCHYIVQAREKIFNVLVKAINSAVPEVMEAGKENMRKFINGGALDSVKDHVRVNIRPLLLLLGDFRSLNMSVLQKLTCFMELFPDLFNEKLCEQLLAHLTRWTEAAKAASNSQNQQQIKPALRSSEEIKICAAIMNMFQLVPAASSKLIEPLVQLTVKTERALILEVGSPFREPLVKFLMRYPSRTADFFLMNIANPLMNRFFVYILNREDGKPLRSAVEGNPLKLVNSTFSANVGQPQTADEQSSASKKRQELQFQGILIIRMLVKHNESWLAQQPVLIGHLRRIWMNETLFEKAKRNDTTVSPRRWREPKLLAKCLLNYIKHRPNEIELLFQILRVFTVRTIPNFHFLKKFLEEVCKGYSIEQKRNVFFKFADCFLDHNYAQELKGMILQHIIIPMFKTSFQEGQIDQLIGSPPYPDQDSAENVISVFINKVIDPQSPFSTSDSVRILLLQFSALLVEFAAPHIHDAANKKQGNKLRRLYQYAWPCLLPKQCVDPATKYHGHYLQAQIIAKFAIHKKFVLQVFHGLLKAHAQEARSIVRQALDILTPVMPHRMEDGNQMLSHWTKKIIVEEGHTVGQLVHMLQLVVRHHEVYFPVRVDLLQHMINSMQRLGFASSATLEHRKLAVDLAEGVIEWEKRNSREEADTASNGEPGNKRPSSESGQEPYPKRLCTPGQSTETTPQNNNSPGRMEKTHTDAVCNFLFRIASQVNEASAAGSSSGEALSRRCFKLLKTALQPDCWPDADLRVTWIDKLFNLVDQTPNANYGNVCTALEILAYLCTVLGKDNVLAIAKPLQRGIVSCMACQNMKVVKAVHALLVRLLTIFPIDQGTGQPKVDDLDYLYQNIGSSIYEGLLSYERSSSSATTILYGPLMLLKAACSSSPTYVDKFMVQFMKALNRMQKDHVSGQQSEAGGLTEMLISSLDLVKNRMGAMLGDLRRIFLSNFTTLIEKSPEAKLLKAMTKIVDEWMKAKMTAQHHYPSIREKSVILYRMMLNFEKRFSDDLELHSQFLEVVNYIYRDESFAGSELTARLEPAFLAGLRSVQPQIRIKFMEVFDRGVKRRLYDRLMFICATQNWEHMGSHFWVKQCLELILAVVEKESQIKCSSVFSKLSSVKSVLRQSDQPDSTRILLASDLKLKKANEADGDKDEDHSSEKDVISIKQEPIDPDEAMDTDSNSKLMEDAENETPSYFFKAKTATQILSRRESAVEVDVNKVSLSEFATCHGLFLQDLRTHNTGPFLTSLSQLCHRSTLLAHKIWVDLFPHVWRLLEEKHQMVLTGELGPFLCSGSHLHQTDCYRSSVNALVEGMANCSPPIPIRPAVLKYLGKTHNLWHRASLLLEDSAVACEDMMSVNPQLPLQQPWLDYGMYDEEVSELPIQETFDSLAETYSMLCEDDMWAGLWQRKSRLPETATAIAYEQQGLYEQAQKAYEAAMAKAREQYNNGKSDPRMLSEYRMWEERWVKAAKELGQWDILMEFGKSKGQLNPYIVLESAWRIPDWPVMKEALTQVEMSSSDSLAYRLSLYRGFVAICNPDEQHQQPTLVEKLVESATTQAIRQWRKLPNIVSEIHSPLLRAAQQIMELQEASSIHVGLQPSNIGRGPNLHDMKAIVKTWRNRLPLQCDELVHWSDIFMWRHHHYQSIVAAYENISSSMPEQQSSNHAMLGVHASAWSIIHYGHVARKHGLTGVCLDSLSRIHTIPSVPIVDCFHKIREQVKCYLQMAGVMGKQELQEGLEVIESTNLRYFSKEMTAEFFALKGMFLAQVNRSEEANKAFSEAVQKHDTLVKAWALWGDYLDNLFVNERNINLGTFAVICYMHACRSQNELKCRKYLARTLWLLSYDDENGTLAESLEKYCIGVPSTHWLPWIPQLLTCFVRKEGSRVLNLIFSVARVFPQAVYFPIRTLYLTLKIEQREKHRMELRANMNGENKSNNNTSLADNDKKVETNQNTKPPGSSSSSTISDAPSPAPLSVSVTANSTAATVVLTTNTAVPLAVDSSDSSTISISTATTTSSADASATAATTTGNVGGIASASQSAGGSEAGMIRAPAPMCRCSKIMHMMRDLHPTLLSALEGIVDQMVWFRECWHEEVLRQLRQGLTKCYQVAFDHRGDVNGAQITPRTLSFVKKLVSTFGIGFESGSNVYSSYSSSASESLARRAQATAQDPVFHKLKEQFVEDFDFSKPGSIKLHKLISKLRKWIRILEAKAKLLPSSFLLEERCRFLSNFSHATAEVELPGEFLMPKTTIHNAFYVRIAKFMPRVELVHRQNFSARRLTIRGHNGKLYPYLVINDAWLTESRREERVLQMFRMVNLFLEKRKETARRHLQFNVPRVVAVSPQLRLIEDNPSIISLSEIYRERCQKRKIDSESAIAHYYDRLGCLQASGCSTNHQVLRDILKEVQFNLIPETMVKEWSTYTYQNATDFWTFRKMFTQQVALAGFVEFTFHLTRLNPEMINIARDSGHVTFNFFKFDLDDAKGELDANRPVPFRLTPNMCELISPVGVSGIITHCMIAVARCLVQPQFSIASYFKAILKDELLTWHKKKHDEAHMTQNGTSSNEMENELLITMVTNATNAIMTRLQNLAQFENAESKVGTLISAAMNPDNLCRMDPAWNPWL